MSDFKATPWVRYFALLPVTVDAYSVSEVKDGHTSYKVWGRWVERCEQSWTDEDDGQLVKVVRYRLIREACENCGGLGHTDMGATICKVCDGTGRVK